ncbi:MAG: class I SAM-dependent methyltransferase [Candidatus Omnitrophica bacterium]|nr:class I SAM-dependent methyltransferase [Candidatus Omnitrophota bacterium]
MAKKNKRDEFLALIPDTVKTILDVGCGDGGLALKLKSPGRKITGIEKHEELCAIAGKKMDAIFCGDVETAEFVFEKKGFDCILYTDALEHLIDPLAVLKKHQDYLCDGGLVLASIPNIRYYKAILNLAVKGVWDYTEKGILDRSHLRFYTLLNIEELFFEAGLEIITIRRNIIASRMMRFVDTLFLGCLKDLVTYQYYVLAQKKDGAITKQTRVKMQF